MMPHPTDIVWIVLLLNISKYIVWLAEFRFWNKNYAYYMHVSRQLTQKQRDSNSEEQFFYQFNWLIISIWKNNYTFIHLFQITNTSWKILELLECKHSSIINKFQWIFQTNKSEIMGKCIVMTIFQVKQK